MIVVSIVTISYNQGAFLRECLESVLNQSYPHIEYIVMDGGSTDGSSAIIASYADRLAYWQSEPDQGAAAALNAGFARATGSIWAVLNSDDLLQPHAVLDWVEKFSREPETDIVYGDVAFIDAGGLPARLPGRRVSVFRSGRWSARSQAAGALSIPQAGSAWRSGVHEMVKGFSPSNRTSWDGEFFADAALAGCRFARIPRVLAKFRIHPGGISGSRRLEDQYRHDQARVEEKWRQGGFLISGPERILRRLAVQAERLFRQPSALLPPAKTEAHPPERVAVVWGGWGRHHYARFHALSQHFGSERCLGVALAGGSGTYGWETVAPLSNLVVLAPAADEENVSPVSVGLALWKLLRDKRISVVFLSSYSPARNFAALIASRLAGVRCVMMNDSNRATESPRAWKRLAKLAVLRLFHSGLVAGQASLEYFSALGLPRSKIFLGYDVVDNVAFRRGAEAARADDSAARQRLGLPVSYYLCVSRLIARKNLDSLLRAYARLSTDLASAPALVLIGGGDEEPALRRLAEALGLAVCPLESHRIPENSSGTVFFGGPRGEADLSAIYALALAFILPSTVETWGLVVNEAMACGLPVLVSSRVGCARDLVIGNGFTFDPDDPLDLAEKMRLLLDSSVRAALAANSLRIIARWDCSLFARNAIDAARAAMQPRSRWS